ncbi:MAG: acetyl-CoA C-acetyltransferase, partial [Rhodoglobus sp.]
RDGGLFDAEIAAAGTCARDEGPRADASLARMAELPSLSDGGRLTAALASQISDGAASLLLAGETALQRHGLVPRARIVASVAVGGDPIMMLTAVMPATRRVLEKAGMQLADIDLFEVNEAFASVVMAWLADTGADPERTNVHGGAIALGHPLGATGARLMTTLLNTMERQGARYGMQVMCEGGGTANATIIERL